MTIWFKNILIPFIYIYIFETLFVEKPDPLKQILKNNKVKLVIQPVVLFIGLYKNFF